MQRKTRTRAIVGAAVVGGLALLAFLPFGSQQTPSVNAQASSTASSTASATASPTASPSPSPSPAPSATAAPFVVTITAVPSTGQTGQSTTFTANLSGGTVADNTNPVFIWNFGDSSSPGTGNPVGHTYTAAGTYPVTVQVLSTSGSGALAYTVIAGLSLSAGGPYSGVVGQSVNMTATGTSLPADTTFIWDFGDGTPRTAATTTATVSHIYTTSGTYTVTLTASSASTGRSGSATTTATISGAGAALALTITGPTAVAAGQSYSYSVSAASSAPSDVIYTWNFGDGTTSTTGTSVNHTWANAGTYSLTVASTSSSQPSTNSSASLTVVASTSQPTGPQVTYGSGWNLVAGPAGTTFSQSNGPLYTFQAGDTAYQVVQNTTPSIDGRGYWAYFNSSVTVTLRATVTSSVTIQAPAGQWIQVGDPSSTQNVTVRGADQVATWNPAANAYDVSSATLTPGRGAWVISLNGGTITIGP